MFAAYPMVWPVATGRHRRRRPPTGAPRKFPLGDGTVPQWRDEAVLGLYEGGTAQTLWAQASGHCARTAGPRGYPPLSTDGCAALGEWPRAGDLELSVGGRNLSRVREAGGGSGSGSGTQGGSGHTPFPFELRSAVTAPARPRRGIDIGKVRVRTGRKDYRAEGPGDSA